MKKTKIKESFMSSLGSSFAGLNNSKYFTAIIMIMLNVGSKYVKIELSKSQEKFLQHNVARQILIFSIVWMGTKDVLIALTMTAVFHVLANHLLNEESSMCLIPNSWRQFEEVLDLDGDGKVTEDEIKNAKDILKKAQIKDRKREMLRNMKTPNIEMLKNMNNFKLSL